MPKINDKNYEYKDIKENNGKLALFTKSNIKMNYKNNQIPKKNHFSPMFYPLPYMPNLLYNFTSQLNQFSLPLSMNIMNHNTNKPKNVIEENN